MKIVISNCSRRERLTIVCEEEPLKTVFVRGHFRMTGSKKVYVKAHYRTR